MDIDSARCPAPSAVYVCFLSACGGEVGGAAGRSSALIHLAMIIHPPGPAGLGEQRGEGHYQDWYCILYVDCVTTAVR